MSRYEDEDAVYERIRQDDIDDLAYELALAAARRTQRRSDFATGLLRYFGSVYEDLRRRNTARRIKKGIDQA